MAATRLGVLGAGTMGSGIALAGLQAGLTVVLVDVSPEMRQRAQEYIQGHLERKGKAERAAGVHFFNPAPVLPLVEIARGAETDAANVQTLVDPWKVAVLWPLESSDPRPPQKVDAPAGARAEHSDQLADLLHEMQMVAPLEQGAAW